MRKHLLLLGLGLCIFNGSLLAQHAWLHPELENRLQQNEQGTERIGLYLNEQLEVVPLKYEMAAAGYTAAERARRVIREAHALQERSQKPVLERLLSRYPQMELVHAYWVANVLLVEAPLSLVRELQREPGIAFIFADKSYQTTLIEPTETQLLDGSPEVPGGREPGLDNINAPAMWALGYTGRGRKAFTVDTGTWTEHPALNHRFLGNYKPLNQGWFSLESRFPVDRPSHHGTHVNGTILGLDTATHDTIGAAFNAYFMASNPLTHSNLTPLSINLLSFEWALNPDGDTSTVDDIPDVINNSWGQAGAADTSICWSWATQIFEVVEAAGVAITFSAGNEGPGPSTVKHPQFNISNLVNIFSIGAINANLSSLPIAGFSSRGPTLCALPNGSPATGPLLIKPEVVAPGVNVRSAYNKDSYASLSGTSMACPHVSGAVVLLKEAFPNLGGDSLLWALYVSAIDMGDPGEDNTFGRGRIDVLAAFNYLSQHHTPEPPRNSGFDVSLAEIVLPAADFYCEQNLISGLTVQMVIRNNGDSLISTGEVYRRNGLGNWMNIGSFSNLAPGQQITQSLGGIPVQSGWNELSLRVALPPGITEMDDINNERSVRFLVNALDTLFINNNPTSYAIAADNFVADSLAIIINHNNDEVQWDTLPVLGLQRDQMGFVLRHNNYGQRQGQWNDLVTRQYVSGGASLEAFQALRFKLAYRNRNTAFADSLRVTVECNCGQDVRTLYYSGGDSMRTYPTGSAPSNASHWRNFEFRNLLLTNGPCFIRFRSINDFGGNMYLGDISVVHGSSSSIAEEMANNIRLYPNPFSQYVVIESTYAPIQAYELLDLQGRRIHNQELAESHQHQIATEMLPAGLYLIRVRTSAGTVVKRLIKQ
ncbi:MAG: S8 family serine peptidase [Bacteroidia bacterium]